MQVSYLCAQWNGWLSIQTMDMEKWTWLNSRSQSKRLRPKWMKQDNPSKSTSYRSIKNWGRRKTRKTRSMRLVMRPNPRRLRCLPHKLETNPSKKARMLPLMQKPRRKRKRKNRGWKNRKRGKRRKMKMHGAKRKTLRWLDRSSLQMLRRSHLERSMIR